MSLKLTYFNDNKGRNELTRLIFAVGGIPYVNEDINYSQYQSLRDGGKLPWGQLPVFYIPKKENGDDSEVKDKDEIDTDVFVFGQSCSISRYAAKQAGLYPTNDLDALRSDEVVDAWRDTLDVFYACFFDRKILGGRLQMVPRPSKDRYYHMQAFLNSELRMQFARYERMLQKNGGQVCVEEGAKFPCWADLALYDLVKTMEGVLTSEEYRCLMEGKKMLTSLVDKIDGLEAIQKHLEMYPYKNISHMCASVPLLRKMIEAPLFFTMELVLRAKSKVVGLFIEGV